MHLLPTPPEPRICGLSAGSQTWLLRRQSRAILSALQRCSPTWVPAARGTSRRAERRLRQRLAQAKRRLESLQAQLTETMRQEESGVGFGELGLSAPLPVEGFLKTEVLELSQLVGALQRDLDCLLQQLKGQPNETLDGKSIRIYCNNGSPEDVDSVLVNDGGGIGLFRSEFLYLNSKTYPTEEEQFEAYKKVLTDMGDKEVIIRTCDIGADKQIDYFELPKEENPAMGMRALRISLSRPGFFRTQLRALYRASAYGNLGIMFPMVTSVWEVRETKKLIESVKKELDAEGLPYSDHVEIGIMIETPAAAVLSDRLAKEVDFFSCGTNDLTQYTLACDRQNNDLGRFYDPHHLSVVRLLKMVVENAHKNGVWVGICGELGADLEMTETFLAIGVDELSVTPRAVLPLRNKVRGIDTTVTSPAIIAAIEGDEAPLF